MKKNLALLSLIFLSLCLSACSTTKPAKNVSYWGIHDRVIEEKNHELGYSIEVHYPEISSHPNTQPGDVVNAKVQRFVQMVMKDFKERVPADDANLRDFPSEMRKNRLKVTYLSYMATPNQDTLISLRFKTKTLFSGHSLYTYQYDVMNDNLSQQKTLELSSLFRENTDYLERISRYCNKKLEQRWKIDMPLLPEAIEGTAPKEENFRLWNLRPNGILITYTEAQLEPYSPHSQSVLVPFVVLNPILAPGSRFVERNA